MSVYQKGAENYVLHDKMTEGLTFGKILSVLVNENEVEPSNYSVADNLQDGCTFEIAFENSYVGNLEAGTEIIVNYTATLNEKAVIAGEGNPNETWLSYGDDNTTIHDFTRTFTWNVNFFKFAEDAEEKKGLEGAKFILSKNEDGSEPITISKLKDEMVFMVDELSDITEMETDPTGEFEIRGLDEGVYYLIETKAPTGYNKLVEPVVITITSKETGEMNNKIRVFEYQVKNEEDENVTVSVVEIENKTSVRLPQTGDMGTRLFYLCGSLMFLSAATLLVVRKRMNSEA